MTFSVQKQSVNDQQAIDAANELEKVIGEIMNGRRKPQNIPMEPMITLIQFARNTAPQPKGGEV